MPSCVVLYPSDDATAPTVAITDNVDGETPTGKVTFTFTFSEDVCSFTADDIVVTGGSRGSFTRIDAKTATLVVSPAENSSGIIDVSMAAGTITDLPGNANTASATSQQAYDSTSTPVAGAIITFDESTPPSLTGFGGAADSTIAPDPADAANSVAKVIKAVGAEVWAGTTVSNLPNQAIAKIGFSSTHKSVTARVWSPDAGIQVRMKVENASNGAQSVETEATTTVAGGWETVTFDFANPVPGTAALDLAGTYNKVSIFFDFGTVGAGKTYYLDDLDFTVTGG
nr:MULTISPECIES: Ig-like domain-containing protein [Cryobacterium]